MKRTYKTCCNFYFIKKDIISLFKTIIRVANFQLSIIQKEVIFRYYFFRVIIKIVINDYIIIHFKVVNILNEYIENILSLKTKKRSYKKSDEFIICIVCIVFIITIIFWKQFQVVEIKDKQICSFIFGVKVRTRLI